MTKTVLLSWKPLRLSMWTSTRGGTLQPSPPSLHQGRRVINSVVPALWVFPTLLLCHTHFPFPNQLPTQATTEGQPVVWTSPLQICRERGRRVRTSLGCAPQPWVEEVQCHTEGPSTPHATNLALPSHAHPPTPQCHELGSPLAQDCLRRDQASRASEVISGLCSGQIYWANNSWLLGVQCDGGS